jgi:hypothetical protein
MGRVSLPLGDEFSMSDSGASVAETPLAKSRFRLSFGLGHLLTLMAGLGVGMAMMQPWKSWERPPAPVDYEVAVVSVPADSAKHLKGDEKALYGQLSKEFGPAAKASEGELIGKLLGRSSLSTIVGESGVMEVTLPLAAAEGKTKPDNFKLEVKPHSVRGTTIYSGVKSTFSWAPSATPKENVLSLASGGTEVFELAKITESSASDRDVRMFLVITPQNAEKRQFTIQATPATASTSGSAAK